MRTGVLSKGSPASFSKSACSSALGGVFVPFVSTAFSLFWPLPNFCKIPMAMIIEGKQQCVESQCWGL